MPAETANYISQLVKSKPSGGESISEGDDHLRAIKTAVTQSFPNVSSAVTSSPAELNAVGKTATDLTALTAVVESLGGDVGDIDTNSHGNIASVYYNSGSILYSHNVASVTKTPGNDSGTRVTFQTPLEGDSPDHFAFSFTPVAGASGRPIVITVTGVTKTHLEFIAIDLFALDGDWSYMEGGTVDFSMIVQDMASGQ